MENVLVTLASKICLTPDQTTTPKDGSPTATDLAAHEENHSGPTTGQPRNNFDFLLKIFSSNFSKYFLTIYYYIVWYKNGTIYDSIISISFVLSFLPFLIF